MTLAALLVKWSVVLSVMGKSWFASTTQRSFAKFPEEGERPALKLQLRAKSKWLQFFFQHNFEPIFNTNLLKHLPKVFFCEK